MKRVLIVGDSPNVSTGFGRVTAAIADQLMDAHGWEVIFLGVNETGEPKDPRPGVAPYVVHRANLNRDTMGTNRIVELARRYEPDVVFMIGDLWNIRHWQAALLGHKETHLIPRACYFPVDGRWMNPEFVAILPLITVPVTYTEFGREVILRAAKVIPDKEIAESVASLDLRIIPHGVDVSKFFPVERATARAFLTPIPEKDGSNALPLTDEFIVLNANRNAERKRLDLTIRAFVKFAAGLSVEQRDKVRLWLHCDMFDSGHTGTLSLIFAEACCDAGIAYRATTGESLLMYTHDKLRQIGSQGGEGGVSDTVLRMIYNACDVGINTSSGEGWGLVTHEHAACAVPQIVPGHSACNELWADVAFRIPVAGRYIDCNSSLEHCIIDEDAAAYTLRFAHDIGEEDRRRMGKVLQMVAQKDAYLWPSIGREWDKVLCRAVELREAPTFPVPTFEPMREDEP